ncbi:MULTISPECIES: peroxiredoxin [unclassified Pseudomonas]|uniref:peroxiredoxin n=1 Tax=Pseudomonas TaxID=286 RepID=UPI000D0220E2|nr:MULTISPECIES: peroxiredoxin [unclassified Pseudomonas]PRN03086.1 peroxiredoxin [Pseudomonas sp. LLC-1]PYG73521.1 peroxiredoxin [Pseudomonas sp. RV120224-01c]PYG79043.1 peroxiredoxin [Pseudomonas sp. RV120224-01b]
MIKTGDQLPDVTLYEYNNDAGICAIGPNAFSVHDRCKQKKVVIFGLPGAFTPTCSERHVPGYVAQAQALFAAGVDEIFCVSVNDAFVMNAWGNSLQVGDAVKMIGDGNGDFSDALGLIQDLSARGLGRRSLRYAMVVDDLIVQHVAVEAPGKFEVSDAASVLAALRSV